MTDFKSEEKVGEPPPPLDEKEVHGVGVIYSGSLGGVGNGPQVQEVGREEEKKHAVLHPLTCISVFSEWNS